MNKIFSILDKYVNYFIAFFIFFYSVGIFGILTPKLSEFFISTTSFALIISIIALIFFHREKWNPKTLAIFATIAVLGFFVEVIGVNTGLIFGEYIYGNTLGIKVFNTPVMIAFNWILMIYTSAAIAQRLNFHVILTILSGAFLMVIYDLLLEPVAPNLDMWTWTEASAPFQNYVAWGIIAIVFHYAATVESYQNPEQISSSSLPNSIWFFLDYQYFKLK